MISHDHVFIISHVCFGKILAEYPPLVCNSFLPSSRSVLGIKTFPQYSRYVLEQGWLAIDLVYLKS